MWFASYLLRKGLVTSDQCSTAIVTQVAKRPVFGRLAIELEKLSEQQVMEVFAAQADDLDKPFGEIAMEKGLLTKDEVADLLTEQERRTPNLGEILVEMGALTHQQMEDELVNARKEINVSK